MACDQRFQAARVYSLIRRGAAAVIDVGLGHPIPQTRLRDPQLLGQLGDRFGLLPRQFDGTTAELGWVGSRHGRILPGGRSHLRWGVRATGGSSFGA